MTTVAADALPFSEWDPRTKKWRVAVRGEDRRVQGVAETKYAKNYDEQSSWTRRFLATRPGATFDDKGRLLISTEDLEQAMKNLQDRYDRWLGK